MYVCKEAGLKLSQSLFFKNFCKNFKNNVYLHTHKSE